MSFRLISIVTAAVAGRCDTAWHRIVGPPGRNGSPPGERRSTVKVRDLTWGSGDAMVWPMEWVDGAAPGGASAVPDTGVLEGLTRLGRRLLLRINVNGRPRTAGLGWDAPPSVDDVEAVLQANLGAEIRMIAGLEVPIRTRRGSST